MQTCLLLCNKLPKDTLSIALPLQKVVISSHNVSKLECSKLMRLPNKLIKGRVYIRKLLFPILLCLYVYNTCKYCCKGSCQLILVAQGCPEGLATVFPFDCIEKDIPSDVILEDPQPLPEGSIPICGSPSSTSVPTSFAVKAHVVTSLP